MKMNLKHTCAVMVAACAVALPSCEDVFDTDTTSVVFEEDNRLSQPGDSLYSVMGILSQVGKLGEKYVLLGELRGDLMETTADADEDMQEVAAFNASPGNSFRSYSDFYAVINNCNYAITRMDTTIAPYGEKLMLPEFVQIKVLRAWTYLQLALARGEVYWLEQPVLDFQESVADYPVKDISQVADALIEDLYPYVDVRPLDYGTVDNRDGRSLFIPIRVLLGDLCLMRNRYEEAARLYARHIGDNTLKISQGYANCWSNQNFRAVSVWNHGDTYDSEALTSFFYSSNANAYHPRLVRWTYNEVPFLVPSESFMEKMSGRPHLYAPGFGTPTPVTITYGDLRGKAVMLNGTHVASGAYGLATFSKVNMERIFKFYRASSTVSGYDPDNEDFFPGALNYTNTLPVYRIPHVYLRFAEALNRMGRPSLAYVILKYGLRKSIVENTSIVSEADLSLLNSFGVDFTLDGSGGSLGYTDNTGTLTRGLGWGVLSDTETYVIPDYTRYVEVQEEDEETGETLVLQVPSQDPADAEEALADSVAFVENTIVDELAAETCFEGNRFFDLYRVACHRGQFPSYMARKVSARFGDAAAAMESRLSDAGAWFLK